MPITPKDEVARIVVASGRTHAEIAAYLSREVGRKLKGYIVGRILSGERAVAADEMDALRRLEGQPQLVEVPERFPPQLTDSGEAVPLYAATGRAGARLRLSEDHRVGTAPIHPSQRGSRGAFAFVHGDDKMGDRLRRGDIGYALRFRAPVKGQVCLVELKNGDAFARIYDREDDHTLFVRVLSPKPAEERIASDEVEAIHVVVGSTFGPG